MTLYDNFQKLNLYFQNNANNQFFNFSNIQPFCAETNFYNFFNNNFAPVFDYFSTNLTKIFPTDIWNSSNTENFNLNNNLFWNYNFSPNYTIDTFTKTNTNKTSTPLLQQLASTAKSYEFKVNSDAEGNRLFSGGKEQAWCVDFVSFNTRKVFGNRLPSSFVHFSSVSALRDWGVNNNCYHKMPQAGRGEYIAQNVKVGDIMIEKDGGKSHTGIVTKIYDDGSFETIEGNCGNKVATQRHKPNSKTLSGFISLEKYTA